MRANMQRGDIVAMTLNLPAFRGRRGTPMYVTIDAAGRRLGGSYSLRQRLYAPFATSSLAWLSKREMVSEGGSKSSSNRFTGYAEQP